MKATILAIFKLALALTPTCFFLSFLIPEPDSQPAPSTEREVP